MRNRTLAFTFVFLFAAAQLGFAARETGICYGTITESCSALGYNPCVGAAGCSWTVSGGQCWGGSSLVCYNPGSGSCAYDPGFCRTESWYCTTGGDCCIGLPTYDSCMAAPSICSQVTPCDWVGGTSQCTGTPTGGCEQYNDHQLACEALGCIWEPITPPSCLGTACTQNYPGDCCSQAQVCLENPVACTADFDCLEIGLGTCVRNFCSIKKTCAQCIPVGNTINTCTSDAQCCGGGSCAGGLCVSCMPESQPCTGSGQGDCCAGLFCTGAVCQSNQPPVQPQAPVLAPPEIYPSSSAVCQNCPLSVSSDPEGQAVAMEYLWYQNGAQLGGWSASAGYAFDCLSAGCSVGDSITFQARACDSLGACSYSGLSNAVQVVDQVVVPPTADPTYMILALLIALGVLTLAYMATYVFDSVIK